MCVQVLFFYACLLYNYILLLIKSDASNILHGDISLSIAVSSCYEGGCYEGGY